VLAEIAISKILHQMVFNCDSVIMYILSIYIGYLFHTYLSHLKLKLTSLAL